ncbi:MAG: endonuclease MutS2 [Clostridia bacterium]|nr:endonuclease MutS2 [Clostridia bacterium]
MNKAYKTLEFDKILDKLAGYTENQFVKDKIYKISKLPIDKARKMQSDTTQGVNTILKLGNPPVSLSVKPVTAYAKRAEQSGILNAGELLDIAEFLSKSRRIKQYLDEVNDDCTTLIEERDNIISAKHIEDKIRICIVSESEIADTASAELATIRRKVRSINGRVRETLNNMIKSSYYKKLLQDPVVTMRSDRFVIPVRAEHKSEVPGIVHDTSSSGATLFIEPMSVVNSNNEIRDLKNKEEQEIERILSELSALVAENAHTIFVNYRCMTNLDFLFAKAKLSLDMRATEPILNDEGRILFKKARHPLIDKDKVVANDIQLGVDYDTLVVTGPNTGGKTVTLKIIGLFSLMAAAGLHIPVADNSEAAVFDSIFADIGDEQSIEQSLSTFSSHMVSIVSIINNLKPNSLALFDELGAGTDPTEGAALAISIIEYLKARGVKTVATTHYSELKVFALSSDRVENASCEFDVKSLQPTYKLLIGVPGKSNAFAISRRLGLNEDIINRANDILSDEDIKFEDVITDLEQSRASAKRDMDEAQRLRSEVKELRAQVEKDRIKLKENKARILEDAHREAKILVMNAKEEANDIIKELEKMRQQGVKAISKLDTKTQKVRQTLKEREESIDKAMARVKKPKKVYTEPPKDLKPGTLVKIIDMDQEATVLKAPDKDGNVKIQAGIIKMDAHITNLRKIDDSKEKAKAMADKYVKSTAVYTSKTKDVSTEVDVRGQMLEEAIMNVEKFLDDCYLAGISPVSIIHGKGTGVLRSGIQEMLRRHKYVKSYRRGKYGEGEDGVTIVELK